MIIAATPPKSPFLWGKPAGTTAPGISPKSVLPAKITHTQASRAVHFAGHQTQVRFDSGGVRPFDVPAATVIRRIRETLHQEGMESDLSPVLKILRRAEKADRLWTDKQIAAEIARRHFLRHRDTTVKNTDLPTWAHRTSLPPGTAVKCENPFMAALAQFFQSERQNTRTSSESVNRMFQGASQCLGQVAAEIWQQSLDGSGVPGRLIKTHFDAAQKEVGQLYQDHHAFRKNEAIFEELIYQPLRTTFRKMQARESHGSPAASLPGVEAALRAVIQIRHQWDYKALARAYARTRTEPTNANVDTLNTLLQHVVKPRAIDAHITKLTLKILNKTDHFKIASSCVDALDEKRKQGVFGLKLNTYLNAQRDQFAALVEIPRPAWARQADPMPAGIKNIFLNGNSLLPHFRVKHCPVTFQLVKTHLEPFDLLIFGYGDEASHRKLKDSLAKLLDSQQIQTRLQAAYALSAENNVTFTPAHTRIINQDLAATWDHYLSGHPSPPGSPNLFIMTWNLLPLLNKQTLTLVNMAAYCEQPTLSERADILTMLGDFAGLEYARKTQETHSGSLEQYRKLRNNLLKKPLDDQTFDAVITHAADLAEKFYQEAQYQPSIDGYGDFLNSPDFRKQIYTEHLADLKPYGARISETLERSSQALLADPDNGLKEQQVDRLTGLANVIGMPIERPAGT